MRRSIPTLLVALALVLAGCNGFAFGGNGTPTETVTPASVPTDEPTETSVPQLAPGLTGQGVTDAFALRQAHASVLDTTSFTVHNERTIRLPNGTPYSRLAFDVQVAENETRYDFVSNSSGLGGPVMGSGFTFESWSNGKRILTRQIVNGSTSYSVPRGPNAQPVSASALDPSAFLGFDPSMDDSIYTLFGAVETRVVGETTRNDTTLYELAAINVTNEDEFDTPILNRSRNVSVRALASPRGLVREYRVNYTATLAGQSVPPSLAGKPVNVHRTLRYTNLGNTTIERPPWYDAALGNVSTPVPTTAAVVPTTATRESIPEFV